MKKYKCLNLDDYILPGYEEITGDALYRINGGGRIEPEQNENPPEGTSSNSSDNYTVQAGLSAGPNGISLGIDFVCDSEYQYIGNTMSLSFGVGTPEGHTRLGGTRIYSVRRKEND